MGSTITYEPFDLYARVVTVRTTIDEARCDVIAIGGQALIFTLCNKRSDYAEIYNNFLVPGMVSLFRLRKTVFYKDPAECEIITVCAPPTLHRESPCVRDFLNIEQERPDLDAFREVRFEESDRRLRYILPKEWCATLLPGGRYRFHYVVHDCPRILRITDLPVVEDALDSP